MDKNKLPHSDRRPQDPGSDNATGRNNELLADMPATIEEKDPRGYVPPGVSIFYDASNMLSS